MRCFMIEKIKKIEKKKLIIAGVFLGLIIVILFGGAFIYNKYFYKRSYSEVEDIMLNATISYLNTNSDKLPANFNDVITLSDTELVTLELMKPINDYLKDETISCSGNVTVTNIDGERYRYNTYLDCGESYHTLKFMDYINKAVPVAESGNGLYNVNEELVYRGDNVNNYLKFSNKTYRIVKFVDNSPVIIYTDERLDNVVWDDRYNVNKSAEVGINDFSVSRIRDSLNNLYKGSTLISESNKSLVIAHNLFIGKRKNTETDKTGAIEKSAIIENQFIGLLPLYDFLNASLDQNCLSSVSASCTNYNYLAKYNYSWWTITANGDNTHQTYKINKSASNSTNSSSASLRPVLHLAKDLLYVSGDGTKNNPYVVK